MIRTGTGIISGERDGIRNQIWNRQEQEQEIGTETGTAAPFVPLVGTVAPSSSEKEPGLELD